MENLEQQLAGVHSAVVAGHTRPDGDCVGSCLATYNYLKEYHPKIKVRLYLEPIPNIFKFLANSDQIISDFEGPDYFNDIDPIDLLIVQDCGDAGRLGKAAGLIRHAERIICIDHQISYSGFGDESYIFPKASSTSELVYGLIGEHNITKEIAECIYVGIIHDTGMFQYSCTSAKTMEIAGKLMGMGIDFPKIADETFYKKTYGQNQILGRALLKSRLYADGKVIASVVTKQEMDEFSVMPRHLDGIVSQLRVTKGVEAAVFLYETGDGLMKVSTRSNGLVNVAEIAVKFGGGGHVRAAGFSMQGDPDTIIETIVAEIKKQL